MELASLWHGQKKFAGAEAACRLALQIAPERADLHFHLALNLHRLGRLEQAEQAYRHALALAPELDEARNNLGVLLTEMQRPRQAQAVLLELIERQPDAQNALLNLGNLYQQQGRSDEAQALFQRVLSHSPQDVSALFNLSNLMSQNKRLAEAQALLRQALELAPSAPMQVNLAFLLLAQGQFEEAWPLHEARWSAHWPDEQKRISQAPDLPYPAWQGGSLKGKRLLVVHEQGHGDILQFVRYVPLLLAHKPAHVTLMCPASLYPLLRQLKRPGLSVRTVASLDELPRHDLWTLLLSLPLHLGTRSLADIPAPIPYLKAEASRQKRWRAQLPHTGKRVGLVWKGAGDHGNDAHRSLPHLRSLAPLWQVSGMSFVSLQKGQAEDEALSPDPGQPLVHLGTLVQDFADSAAIVSQLDLVICVDTAVAHLAGALGIRCWVLLPHHRTDWRWLQEGQDSPWYPEVLRLFRQGAGEAWDAVIARVAAALQELSPG